MNTHNDDFDFRVNNSDIKVPVVEPKVDEDSNTHVSHTTTPNVQPQIPDDTAPFIVLCGPPASGKSMVLKSLASYLYESGDGYTIKANRTLLNTVKYQNDCTHFDKVIGKPNERMENTVDYLMADISDRTGNVVAHFLEAPGEDFFSLTKSDEEPDIAFKNYMHHVAQTSPNSNKQRKVIYIILLDLDSATSFRNNPELRKKYQDKMMKLYRDFVLDHPSRVILLYNKVDLPQGGLWANANSCRNIKAVKADAERNYKNLFFTRKFLFWDIEDFSFLPYCTGSYPDDGSYTASGPAYPAALWKEITKQLW